MKRSILAFLLAFSLFLTGIPLSYAFPDTQEHWAREYVDRTVEAGLFNGVSEDRFAPDETMTRAMFVTVLGRFEGIDTEYWSREGIPQFFKQDCDENAYYAPHIRWGVCNGIVNGMNDVLFAPNRPITREQMAKLVSYYIDAMGHCLVSDISLLEQDPLPESPSDTEPVFADFAEISSWATDSVMRLYYAGILTGFAEEDGTYTFRPTATATRAQCAAVFCRIQDSLIRSDVTPPLAEEISLTVREVTLEEGETYQLEVQSTPVNIPLLFRTSDSTVVTVDQAGILTYVGPGYAQIYVYTRNGLYDFCEVVCKENQDPGNNETTDPNPNLPNANFTKEQKSIFMFGESVKDPRLYYSTSSEAKADMVNVEIRAWYLKSNGEKVPRTWTLEVHKSLADTVKAIFEEIYNGPEQFPIHEIYCYSWSGKSEHSIGSAIDINWSENYYCDPYGNALVGNYWKPGEDPYSITPGGDLATAFIKYGYIWGINWNSGYKDYMHFSFFGT